MGRLMLTLSHFNKAEELYYELLKNATRDEAQGFIYHQLGLLKDENGKHEET